jgi:Flp pilus assembly protein TadB
MSSRKRTQAFDARAPRRLEGWKIAISIGAALVVAPVMALVLIVVLAAVLPVLPFLLTLILGTWGSGRRRRRPRSTPALPPIVFRPSVGHPAAS